jgi:hypothetical protein
MRKTISIFKYEYIKVELMRTESQIEGTQQPEETSKRIYGKTEETGVAVEVKLATCSGFTAQRAQVRCTTPSAPLA